MGFPFYVVYIVLFFIIGLAMLAYVSDDRHIVDGLFAFYIIAVLIITILGRTYDIDINTMFNPLVKYSALGKELEQNGWKCFTTEKGYCSEIVLNILLFVPLGFLVPILKESFQRAWKMLLLGLGFSLFIECTQLLLHAGCFDTADLIHNTSGAGIGYLAWWKWMKT